MAPTIRQLDDLHRDRTDLQDLDLSTAPGRLVALDLVTTMETILGQIRDAEDEAEHLLRMKAMDQSILKINDYAAQIRGTVAARQCPVVTMSREEEEAFDELERRAGSLS